MTLDKKHTWIAYNNVFVIGWIRYPGKFYAISGPIAFNTYFEAWLKFCISKYQHWTNTPISCKDCLSVWDRRWHYIPKYQQCWSQGLITIHLIIHNLIEGHKPGVEILTSHWGSHSWKCTNLANFSTPNMPLYDSKWAPISITYYLFQGAKSRNKTAFSAILR